MESLTDLCEIGQLPIFEQWGKRVVAINTDVRSVKGHDVGSSPPVKLLVVIIVLVLAGVAAALMLSGDTTSRRRR